MVRYFTHYWANDTVEDYRQQGTEGEPFGGLLSNEFVRMGLVAGDVLYPVTVRDGELYVLGRMEVADVQPYDGRELDEQGQQWRIAAYAKSSTPRRFDNLVPTEVAEQLECLSDGRTTKLKFAAPGKLDRQTLRAPRQLTVASARLLDAQIDRYEHNSKASAASAVAAWLFQYHQPNYEVAEFVARHGEYDWWDAPAHRSELRVGDRLYFRRTRGEQPSGLTAVGRIVSQVYATGIADHPYRIDVHYEQAIGPPLTTEEAADDEVLAHKPALARGVQGTIFGLTLAEAERIRELLGNNRLHDFAPHARIFDPDIQLDERTRTLAPVVQRQGLPEFRNRLIAAYEGRCAVTGCDAVEALEAAHIHPYLGQHTNVVTNGLLLRADIHTLFDKGLLAIDGDHLTVVLNPTLKGTVYHEFDGKAIHLPRQADCQPSRDSLRHHRQKSGL